MDVDTCMLCDAVTVREGLLHILGGGITDVERAEYPAPLGISLALRILLHPTELAHPHQFEVLLQDADGEQVTKVDMALGAFRVDIPVGKLAPIALSWDFPGKPVLPHAGRYAFELLIDGVHQRTVSLNAVLAEKEGGEER